jgi:LysM repeat protein
MWLSIPRHFSFPSFSFVSPSGIRKIISPCFTRRKDDVEGISKVSNKLFSRYAAAVSLILIMGMVTPSEASFMDTIAMQIDAGIDSTASESVLISDNDGYFTKINPQTSDGDRSAMNDHLVHTVAAGETVSTIANSYGLKSATVLWENGISNANSIRVGQKLFIPPVDGQAEPAYLLNLIYGTGNLHS